MTTVIRAECDLIDAQIAGLTTERDEWKDAAQTEAAEVNRLNGQLATANAEIARLQAIIEGDADQTPEPITLVSGATIPATAPVVGEPFTAMPSVYTGGGGEVSVVYNWYVGAGGTFKTSRSDNPIIPVTSDVGKELWFEDVVTFANGETRTFKTGKSLDVVAAAEPAPDPDPIPDPEPQPGDGTVRVDVWMLPEATGDGSGSSPENAKAWSALASTVGPDVHIGLIADKGVYPGFSHTFSKGGAAGAPSVIAGVNQARQPRQVTLKSTRPQLNLDYDPEWARAAHSGGHDFFNLKRGADYLNFNNMILSHGGECFKVLGTIRGLGMDWIDFVNVKEGLWMDNDPEPAGTEFAGQKRSIIGGLFKRTRVTGAETGFRIMGDSTVVFEGVEGDLMRCMGNISFFFSIGKGEAVRTDRANVTIYAKKHGYSGVCKNAHDQHGNKPWMWVGSDGAKHLLYAPADANGGYGPIIPRTIVKNPAEWRSDGLPGSDYWNGDIVSAENLTTVHIEDMTASGCPDGGFDIKSISAKLIRCTARDNKRNFRFHGEGKPDRQPRIQLLEDCLSDSPRKRGGGGGTIHTHITGGDASGDAGLELTVRNCTYRGSPPTNAFTTDSERRWGIKMTTENNTYEDGISGTPLPFIA